MKIVTYHVSEEDRVLQQIHILECLVEVLCDFPKSMASTPSPSEPIVNITKYVEIREH